VRRRSSQRPLEISLLTTKICVLVPYTTTGATQKLLETSGQGNIVTSLAWGDEPTRYSLYLLTSTKVPILPQLLMMSVLASNASVGGHALI
jgi:hypothetical protein